MAGLRMAAMRAGPGKGPARSAVRVHTVPGVACQGAWLP